MPIYEYTCLACGHEFELIQKINDAAIKKCPDCGKLKVQKLVSASRFQLKGTGWYETDFKDKKKPAAETTEQKKPEKEGKSKPKDGEKSATTT